MKILQREQELIKQEIEEERKRAETSIKNEDFNPTPKLKVITKTCKAVGNNDKRNKFNLKMFFILIFSFDGSVKKMIRQMEDTRQDFFTPCLERLRNEFM